MSTSSPSAARGWIVTLAAVGINLILGSLYAWGVIGKQLVGQWHWTKADAALPFTASTVAFALTMIFAGRAQDKMGPRVVAMLGGYMFGLGLIASSLVKTPQLMLLTYGILGGAGIGLCYSATTPPSIKWFPAWRKGIITGIVVSGVGIAAVYVSPLTQYLLSVTSISQTFLILGTGAVIMITVLSQFLANPPAGFVPAGATAPATSPAVASGRRDLDWQEMLKTGQFYRLWLMFVLSASAGLMIIAHAPLIAKEQAHLDKWSFLPVAMLAIFNTLGRVVSGFLSDRIGRPRTMTLAYVVQAVNMAVFSFYTTPETLLFGAGLTGLCYGTIFTLMPAATADFYGVRNLGVNYGLVFTAFGVAGVAGPMLGGAVKYSTSYQISAAMLVVGAILAFTAHPPAKASPAAEKKGEAAKVG